MQSANYCFKSIPHHENVTFIWNNNHKIAYLIKLFSLVVKKPLSAKSRMFIKLTIVIKQCQNN